MTEKLETDWIKKYKMPLKMETFVMNYLISGNATSALKKSCYKFTSNCAARNQANRLVQHPKASKAIIEGRKLLLEEAEFGQKEILKELIMIATSDIKKFVKWSEKKYDENDGHIPGTGDINLIDSDLLKSESRIISEISETNNGKKIKLYPKMDALKTLGSYHGMWKDIHEHSGTDGTPLNIEKVKTSKMSDIELNRVVQKMLKLDNKKNK